MAASVPPTLYALLFGLLFALKTIETCSITLKKQGDSFHWPLSIYFVPIAQSWLVRHLQHPTS